VDVEDAVVVFERVIGLYALQSIRARESPLLSSLGAAEAPLEAATRLGAHRVFNTLDGGLRGWHGQVAAWPVWSSGRR
jgi:hypothetical protein